MFHPRGWTIQYSLPILAKRELSTILKKKPEQTAFIRQKASSLLPVVGKLLHSHASHETNRPALVSYDQRCVFLAVSMSGIVTVGPHQRAASTLSGLRYVCAPVDAVFSVHTSI